MRSALSLPILALLVAAPAAAQECRHEAERGASLSAAGLTRLDVRARAGSLQIQGVPNAGEVRLRARACASSQELLSGIDFALERADGAARLGVEMPDMEGFFGGNRYARLDLVLEVPAGMDAEIDDSSGEIVLRDLGALRIHDNSGEIEIERAGGDVYIDDGSGEIMIAGVAGELVIEDGSGEIEIADVRGSVRIDDGSGSIDVRDVARDVLISDDGSGSIRVAGVGGDFTVGDDGSGSIRYTDVRGTVRIPDRRNR